MSNKRSHSGHGRNPTPKKPGRTVNRDQEGEEAGAEMFAIFGGGGGDESGGVLGSLPSHLGSPVGGNNISRRKKNKKACNGRGGTRRVRETQPLNQTCLDKAKDRQKSNRSIPASISEYRPFNRQSTDGRSNSIMNNLSESAKKRRRVGMQTGPHPRDPPQARTRGQPNMLPRKNRNKGVVNAAVDVDLDSAPPDPEPPHPYKNNNKQKTQATYGSGDNQKNSSNSPQRDPGYMKVIEQRVNPRRASSQRDVVVLQDDRKPKRSTGNIWQPGSNGSAAKKKRAAREQNSSTRYHLASSDSDEKDPIEDPDSDIERRSRRNRSGARSSNGITTTKIAPQISFQKSDAFRIPKKKGTPRTTQSSATIDEIFDGANAKDSASGNRPILNLQRHKSKPKPRSGGGNPIRPGNSLKKRPSPSRQSEDDDRSSTRSRKSPRLSTKKPKENSVIEILSDEESEAPGTTQESHEDDQSHTPSRAPKYFAQSVPRIAIGERLLTKTGCNYEVGFNQLGELGIYNRSRRARLKSNDLKVVISFAGSSADDVKELQYYIGEDATATADAAGDKEEERNFLSFLALRVDSTETNMLKPFRTKYQPDTQHDQKSYIIIEFHTSFQLLDLFDRIREQAPQYADVAPLSRHEAAQIRTVLAQEDDKENEREERKKKRKKRRQRANEPKVTDEFVAGRPQDEVLLVYPFAGDPAKIEGAADGLAEASAKIPDVSTKNENTNDTDFSSDAEIRGGVNNLSLDSGENSTPTSAQTDGSKVLAKTEQRKHFCTIQVRDFERLCPGEFLNDTLIDFWIQWMTRHIDPREGPNPIHCFSSHFFTTLVDEGVDSVTKWTAKKGINVFEKKFVFIPINETLHWSLCVVVNPGHINDRADEDPMACLLFLDSLKAHKKKKVARKVREWLNSEWKRIKSEEKVVGKGPFGGRDEEGQDACPLLDPRIPYQDNSWDCGVFVCRYAYAVLCLRNKPFTRGDRWFGDSLGDCDVFKFDMADIALLRDEIRTMIERMSTMYLPWKLEHDKNAKLESREAKKKMRVRQANEAAAAEGAEKEETSPVVSDESASGPFDNDGKTSEDIGSKAIDDDDDCKAAGGATRVEQAHEAEDVQAEAPSEPRGNSEIEETNEPPDMKRQRRSEEGTEGAGEDVGVGSGSGGFEHPGQRILKSEPEHRLMNSAESHEDDREEESVDDSRNKVDTGVWCADFIPDPNVDATILIHPGAFVVPDEREGSEKENAADPNSFARSRTPAKDAPHSIIPRTPSYSQYAEEGRAAKGRLTPKDESTVDYV